jgi:hypothetical protein
VARCWHEEHHRVMIQTLDVWVNEGGNLCDDLPMLCLANQQIFHEMFDMFFPKQVKKKRVPEIHRKVKVRGGYFVPKAKESDRSITRATVYRLDVFPFLQFCQMLGKAPHSISLEGRNGAITWTAGVKSLDHIEDEFLSPSEVNPRNIRKPYEVWPNPEPVEV